MDTGDNILVKEETEGGAVIMYGRRQGEGSSVEVFNGDSCEDISGEIEATINLFIGFPGLRIES